MGAWNAGAWWAGLAFVPSTLRVNGDVLPQADDGGTLGSATRSWSDLFLASGAVINFNNGDVTLTHSANALTLAGGQLLLPDGTESLPAVARSSQSDTGIYWDNDSLYFTRGGIATFGMSLNELRLGSARQITWSSNTNPTAATGDVFLSRHAAGHVKVTTNGSVLGTLSTDKLQSGVAANGYYSVLQTIAEAHTLALAGTSDTAAIIPANALVIGVSFRVTTEITGCTSIDAGVAGATTRYGTGVALVAGTTNVSAGVTNPTVYGTATAIRFTAVGGGASFTAGVIRVVVHYISLTPPTS